MIEAMMLILLIGQIFLYIEIGNKFEELKTI